MIVGTSDDFLAHEKNRHKYAYLPFSLGDRSCIGISFALQESKIALATLIRKYQFGRVDMDTVRYDPKSITMKPLNLEMRIQTRTHFNPPSINIKDYSVNSDQPLQPAPLIAFKYRGELPFIVFHFGSDMGTSEDFARQMYQTAKNYNLKQVDIQVLDSQLQFDSKAIHVIIVSTYNGEPPANAKKFKEFIASAAPETMKGVRFAVYGCGNSQWRTFQKVPMFIDHQMELLGGTRIMPIGNGDANEDIETHFYAWQAKFWLMLQEEHGFYPNENETHPLLTSMSSAVKINDIGKAIEFSTPPSLSKYPSAQNLSTSVAVSVLYQNIEGNIKELKLMSRGDLWKVDSKQELINPVAGLPQKSVFHIVLSGNTPYNTGDHFELWPENSISHVQAIAELLQCDLDTVIKLENVVAPTKSVAFQVRGPFTIRDCFKNHCDFLGQPSKFLIETMLLKQNERDKAAKIRMQDISLYQHYTSLYRRTLDVFLNANVKWTLEDVLCGCNKITPRLFSVASCREYSGEAVHLSSSS
ncbi:hypothetical protein HMI55_000617 [Coelomomyces lativittatus]|nr:hypothetical protein HMI55_000617 [Coelomomyces lativittatus]